LELLQLNNTHMNTKYYTDQGFEFLCDLIPSDKYKQGIALKVDSLMRDNREHYKQPGVYILANNQGEVLKIGQTSNMFNRIYTQYKCVNNITNRRIREHIKTVEDVTVYVYLTPRKKSVVLGHTVYTSYAAGLEHELLKEFKQKTTLLPKLNTMLR